MSNGDEIYSGGNTANNHGIFLYGEKSQLNLLRDHVVHDSTVGQLYLKNKQTREKQIICVITRSGGWGWGVDGGGGDGWSGHWMKASKGANSFNKLQDK